MKMLGGRIALNIPDTEYAKENNIIAFIFKESTGNYIHSNSKSRVGTPMNYRYGKNYPGFRQMPNKSLKAYIVSLDGIDYYRVFAYSLEEAVVTVNKGIGVNCPSPNPAPPPPGQTVIKTRSKVVQRILPNSIVSLIKRGRIVALSEVDEETKETFRNSLCKKYLLD